MEQLKVLAAALALRDFTVDEISGLSGVNPSTVRSVLRRNRQLIRPAGPHGDRSDTNGSLRSRGRPSNRWTVVEGDQIRKLVEEIRALPKFEPSYTDVDADDWRSAAVAVAEDALAQVNDESDEFLRERLFSSARSGLLLAEEGISSPNGVPWWQAEDSPFAVRARGVDALVALASTTTSERPPGQDVLWQTSQLLADAMQAAPDGREAAYFAPFSQVLAHSGEFAPLYAVCTWNQYPAYPFAGEWTEVAMADFHPAAGRICTQAWAKPLVNVSAAMPIVLFSYKMDDEVDQMINGIKTVPRPAAVLGPTHESLLIKKSGWAGASYVPVDEPGYDRQYAIDSVAALIDRFSVVRR
jgi:hypothetical protein